MLVPRVTRLTRECTRSGTLRGYTSRCASTSSDEVPERPERKLREWRKWPEPEQTFLQMFNRKQPKGTKYVLPKRFTFDLVNWFRSQRLNFLKYDQRFIAIRHKTLGCDLAAGHFLVSRGGKVKYEGQSDWVVRSKDGYYKLPDRYDAKWRLTHIDASGLPLYYEGIDNFRDLGKAVWANFGNNPHFDDWCVDILCANFPNLQYLDVSRCPRVTERCLEGIYRLSELKTLIITDWRKDIAFELAAVMLEDCMPNLTIRIKDPQDSISTG